MPGVNLQVKLINFCYKSSYLAFQVDFFQFIFQVHKTLKKWRQKRKFSLTFISEFLIKKYKHLLQNNDKESKHQSV